MHCKSLASILVAGLSIVAVSAAPHGSPTLEARTCTTGYPSWISYIDSSNPTQSFPNSNQVTVSLSATSEKDALVQFTNIPSGSYGCQFEAFFPAGFTVTNTDNAQVYVYSVDRQITPTDTWNNAPNKVSQVGTANFVPSATADTKVVINSFVCTPSMSFRIRINSDSGFGSTAFTQANAAGGFRVTYNC
ncbi:MAG: hypothetical protein M1813_004468 [Trichoglossum hirsutum]|nr:MAG: hypothetical protein M1813_004468 [Trichoglossum hirsutum]